MTHVKRRALDHSAEAGVSESRAEYSARRGVRGRHLGLIATGWQVVQGVSGPVVPATGSRLQGWLGRDESESTGALERVDRIAMPEGRRESPGPRLVGRLTGPVRVLAGIARAWRLTDVELATLLAYDDAASANDLLGGLLTLRGRDREDRVRHVFWIHEMLEQMFPDPDAEATWLRTAVREFGGISPLDQMLRGSMEHLLSVRWFVERISGR